MNFQDALTRLKTGKRLYRAAWKSDKEFVVMMPALYLPAFNDQEGTIKCNDRTAKHIGKDTALDSQPYLAHFTEAKKWQPGWTPGTADLFADDWRVRV